MTSHISVILAGLELLAEEAELRRLGLTDEEIEGYLEFYKDNYPELRVNDEVSSQSQVQCSAGV